MNHPNENEQIAQQPDSDYCSDIDDRDGNAQPVLRAHGGNDFVMVHHGDEWIELDLPADFAHSLGFLTDADFQAVLKSFSEFTNQQLSAVNCTANELQGILRNQLAYLLWRRAVLIKLGQFPPIQVEGEQLDQLLDMKWREESEVMTHNRHRFCSLADATTVPRLVLATIKSFCRKRNADHGIANVPNARKRMRRH